MAQKKFIFSKEELEILRSTRGSMKHFKNALEALDVRFKIVINQAFTRMGLDKAPPGIKREVKFDIDKNEILARDSPEITKASHIPEDLKNLNKRLQNEPPDR